MKPMRERDQSVHQKGIELIHKHLLFVCERERERERERDRERERERERWGERGFKH